MNIHIENGRLAGLSNYGSLSIGLDVVDEIFGRLGSILTVKAVAGSTEEVNKKVDKFLRSFMDRRLSGTLISDLINDHDPEMVKEILEELFVGYIDNATYCSTGILSAAYVLKNALQEEADKCIEEQLNSSGNE